MACSSPGREQVDDRAAHRIFAGVVDRVGPLVAVGDQQLDQPVALDPLALGQPPGQLADAERRQDPLGRGIGRGDQQLRAVALALQLSSVASRSAMTRRAGDARS